LPPELATCKGLGAPRCGRPRNPVRAPLVRASITFIRHAGIVSLPSPVTLRLTPEPAFSSKPPTYYLSPHDPPHHFPRQGTPYPRTRGGGGRGAGAGRCRRQGP